MPAVIVETATKGSAISAPVDADVRNAASVRTPFQSVGNRLKFLENFYDAFYAAITFSADSIWTIADGKKLKVQGDLTSAQSGIFDLTAVFTKFAGNVTGPLFLGGTYGRANRKVATLNATGTIDATAYDTVFTTPTAVGQTITVNASPYVPYVAGDRLVVYNYATGFALTLSMPGGAFYTIPVASVLQCSWGEAIYDGTIWRRGRTHTAV